MGLGPGLILRKTENRRTQDSGTKDSVLSQRGLKIGLWKAALL